MQKGKRKRLAIAVAFALSLSSAVLPGASALAQQGPVNDELTTPFGLVAEYDAEKGIGFVWGEAGYEKYTVTISNSATGYEKVYTDQTLGYKYYPDDYEPGDYLVEIQGLRDGEYSKAASVTVTVPYIDEGSDDKDKGDGDQDTEHNPGSEEDNEEGNSDGSLPTDPDTDTPEGDGQGDKDTDNKTDEDDTEESQEGAISLADAKTELYVGSDWAGCSAEVKENGTVAQFKVSSYGWNGEWGLQYIIKDLGLVEGGTYTVYADITSSIDKKVLVKLDDSGQIVETITLSSGKTYEYEKEVTIDQLSNDYLYFALGQISGEAANLSGTLTIENLRIKDQDGNYLTLSGGSASGSKGLEYDFDAEDNYLSLTAIIQEA